jgi:hypothetical protein
MTVAEREQILGAALRLLAASGHPRTGELMKMTEVLARIRLNRSTIDRIRRENAMNSRDYKPLLDYFRNDDWAVEAREQGLEQGREQGRERLLRTFVAARFGDSPQARAAAERLRGWDEEAAARAITTASDLTSLLGLEAPVGPSS